MVGIQSPAGCAYHFRWKRELEWREKFSQKKERISLQNYASSYTIFTKHNIAVLSLKETNIQQKI